MPNIARQKCYGTYLPPTKEGVYVFAHVRLSVCLSVSLQDYSKTRACIWMKCCVSTDVGTWTNCLTFEPDPGYSPDAGTGLLSPISYKRCNVEFYYVRKIPRIRIGRQLLQRGVVLKWFYSPRAVGTPLSEVHSHTLYRVPFEFEFNLRLSRLSLFRLKSENYKREPRIDWEN